MNFLAITNEKLHQTLVQRAKDRQREEYIAALHTRQYPLPVVLLKIVISYLPGYFMHWLPSGELTFTMEMSLTRPMRNVAQPLQIKYDDPAENDDDDENAENDDEYDKYAYYENKYNPDSDY